MIEMGVLQRLRACAAAAFAGEPVVFAYVFGSTATGRARPDSDVDVAVYLDERVPAELYLRYSLDLAGRLQAACPVGRFDAVVVLNEAPLPLAGRIRRDRQVIYARDEPFRVSYESLTARRFNDFEIHAKPRDRERLRRIAAGRR
jgi:predicted nucleotidyltransferase